MKKTLLLSVLALLGAWLQAQPVLDQTAVGAIGSVYYLGVQDTFSPGFSIGSAGANQTWNLDTLLVNGLDTISFVSPSSSSYAGDFPTSNLAITQASLNGGIAFLESSPSGLDILGLAADLLNTGSPIVFHQNPPSRVAQFPFTYGNSFQNTTEVDITIDASSFGIPLVDSARTRRIQDRFLTADGYGSLSLPSANYTSVLRVKDITTETDSVWIHTFFGWQLYQDSVYTDSTFTWWNGSKGYYLAQASYIGGQLNSIRYQDPVVVGMNEPLERGYLVYPNPAHDLLQIETDGKVSELKIIDLQGKIIARYAIGGAHAQYNIQQLPVGYYLYELSDKNGLPKQRGKLLIEH